MTTATEQKFATQNAMLLALVVAIALLQFFLVPLLLPVGASGAVALVFLCMVATPLHWGLMHESIHANLFGDPVANRRAGRLLGVLLGLSWDVMRFGHLLHHSNNRHEFDRPEAIEPGSSRARAALPYFARLVGGHALISAVSTVGLALPSRLIERLVPNVEPMRTAALRSFLNTDRRTRIRADVAAIALLTAVAVWCWGAQWLVFSAAIAARFFMLSLLDNAPHYGTALDSGTYARNARLPRWAACLVTGHNFHGIHHAATGLKWQELRAAFVDSGAAFEGDWTTMVLRQFRGPVFLEHSVGRRGC